MKMKNIFTTRKSELAWENIVKAILALTILAVVIAVFYLLFKPAVEGTSTIEGETRTGGGSILDDLSRLFGRTCDSGDSKCNRVSGICMTCNSDQEWETPENGRICKTDDDCT